MKRYCLNLLLIALLSGLAGAALAGEQQEPIEFGFIEFPPFGYTNSEGEANGYLVKLSKRVFREMDLPVHFQQHPAKRLYRQLKTGRTAMTLASDGLYQLRNTAFESQEPAITLTLAIYHRQDTEPVFYINGLKGKRVVLIQGYSYGPLQRFFEEQADSMEISYARTHASALKMVLYGRADYLLNYQTPADTVIARNGLGGLKSQVIGKTPVHLFVSKEVEGAQRITEQWDRQLKKLRENGELPVFNYYNKFE